MKIRETSVQRAEKFRKIRKEKKIEEMILVRVEVAKNIKSAAEEMHK